MNVQALVDYAKEHGFSAAAPLDVSSLHFRTEVRDMCNSDKCHMIGKNWACPPGCGELEECAKRVSDFSHGLIVQTVGELEDSMDFEGMQDTEEKHKATFENFANDLRKDYRVLALGAGSCTRCKVCTYPDAPCRFPDKMTSSMEAYGLLVSQVCTDNQLPYYYGNNTIAYTSCYLIEEKE